MDDQRDYEEENYNRNICPECDHSPCAGGNGKGSCATDRTFMDEHFVFMTVR